MTEVVGSNFVAVSRRIAEIQSLLDVAPQNASVVPAAGASESEFALALASALAEPAAQGQPSVAPPDTALSLPAGFEIPPGYALVPLSALGMGAGGGLATPATPIGGAAIGTVPSIAPSAAPAPSTSATVVPASVVAPPSEQAALRVALAMAEIGVVEDPPGSNDAARIAEYRTATSGAGVGPWCAYFTSWIGAKAGTPLGADGQGEGYVPTMANWLRGSGRYVTPTEATPRPGDLVFFDWERDGELDHIGLVQSVGADGRIYTIEGNADDAVKQRSWAPSQIAGYGLLP